MTSRSAAEVVRTTTGSVCKALEARISFRTSRPLSLGSRKSNMTTRGLRAGHWISIHPTPEQVGQCCLPITHMVEPVRNLMGLKGALDQLGMRDIIFHKQDRQRTALHALTGHIVLLWHIVPTRLLDGLLVSYSNIVARV